LYVRKSNHLKMVLILPGDLRNNVYADSVYVVSTTPHVGETFTEVGTEMRKCPVSSVNMPRVDISGK
jgi:hypothetical protein